VPLPNPVIVVPGITATYLDDRYPLPPETIWKVLDGSKDYSRAALHPDDTRYEAQQPSLVRPGQLYEDCYRELIEELRFNLRDSELRPVPVFPFSYDWRQPLEASVAALEAFAEEVRGRTRLLRHYAQAGYGDGKDPGDVDFVGHSMGGLVIAGLAKRVRGAGIGRVVTMGTPFRGSLEPIIKITTGTANLGVRAPSSREREAARVTPALYHLLPRWPGAVVSAGPQPEDMDIHDPANWQPSIVATMEEYIREKGLPVPGQSPRRRAERLLRRMLEEARAYRESLEVASLAHLGMEPDDWLCIAGVDSTTRLRVQIERVEGSYQFLFTGSDRDNRWRTGEDGNRRDTGDGTVPLEAAIPYFLPREKVVCVRPKDYNYWEIGDRLFAEAAGFHGMMPGMDMLHRLIVRFFKGGTDDRRNTWGRPVPGVADWAPPLVGGLYNMELSEET
jgi:pimeloyl-ACP methyl ester carboxylesterase